MSSDLLKEFGSLETNPWSAIPGQNSEIKAFADEDEFGDFEDPENEIVTHTQSSSPPPNVVRYSAGLTRVRPRQIDEEYLQPHVHSSSTEGQHAPNDNDDWGDFSQQSIIFDADVEVTRQKKEAERTGSIQCRPEEPTNTLLDTTAGIKASSPTSQVPTTIGVSGPPSSTKARLQSTQCSSSRQDRAEKATNIETITADDDEPWADFEAAETAEPRPKPSNAPPPRSWKVVGASNLGPPPSNIPPPSILLHVIAAIFRCLATDLKIIQSQMTLDQPSTLSPLHDKLSTIRAAARILAGRKLRWKRDSLLSQSMKIGPAHSGKAGGMKLAGVDKAESRREDQEAAEALLVWRQQAGPVRSTIAALNGQLPEHERFKMVDVTVNMPIRQGKPSEGVVSAPKCCFLCGIKRDERVAKIDVDVEDSFGEWWVEHWGHADCVAFWENHKGSLAQR